MYITSTLGPLKETQLREVAPATATRAFCTSARTADSVWHHAVCAGTGQWRPMGNVCMLLFVVGRDIKNTKRKRVRAGYLAYTANLTKKLSILSVPPYGEPGQPTIAPLCWCDVKERVKEERNATALQRRSDRHRVYTGGDGCRHCLFSPASRWTQKKTSWVRKKRKCLLLTNTNIQ